MIYLYPPFLPIPGQGNFPESEVKSGQGRLSPCSKPLLYNAREQRGKREPYWNWTDHGSWFWDCPIRPERVEAARTENAITVDCWKYSKGLNAASNANDWKSSDEPCDSEISYIDDEKLESWAKQPVPLRDGEMPRAGLRLVHICSDRYPFPEEILATIEEIFSIPHVELSTSSYHSGVCATIFTKDLNHPVFICRSPIHNTSVTSVVRYDPSTNMTVGYILSGSASEIHFDLVAIPKQFDICEHPLLVPVVMAQQYMEVLSSLTVGIKSRLDSTERISENFIESSKPTDQSYFKGTAHWLSNETRSFALCQAQIHACGLRNTFLEQQLDALDTWMQPALIQDMKKNTLLLKERITYNTSNLEHLKVYSGVGIRLEALKSLLFNLIAQEDNQANLRLSREMRQVAIKTKKDGSTMKLIAILGAIFLPATFVSTFFAMPFFNWDAPTASEVVSNHFWVYWILTGPLTLVTLLLVGAWVIFRNRTIDADSDDESSPKGANDDKSQTDSQPMPSKRAQLKPCQIYESGSPHDSGYFSSRLGKVIKSAFGLRSRKKNTTSGAGDEESRI